MDYYRVVIVGSAYWCNADVHIAKLLKMFPKETVFIHGGCSGIAETVEIQARKLGYKTLPVRPNYKEYGKNAGKMRNIDLIDKQNPDLVIAVESDNYAPKGELCILTHASSRGIRNMVIKFDDKNAKKGNGSS